MNRDGTMSSGYTTAQFRKATRQHAEDSLENAKRIFNSTDLSTAPAEVWNVMNAILHAVSSTLAYAKRVELLAETDFSAEP